MSIFQEAMHLLLLQHSMEMLPKKKNWGGPSKSQPAYNTLVCQQHYLLRLEMNPIMACLSHFHYPTVWEWWTQVICSRMTCSGKLLHICGRGGVGSLRLWFCSCSLLVTGISLHQMLATSFLNHSWMLIDELHWKFTQNIMNEILQYTTIL